MPPSWLSFGLLLIALTIFLMASTTLFFLLKSIRWLRDKPNFKDLTVGQVPSVYILIPALREQKRIIPTLRYFSSNFLIGKIKLIVITTQKELAKQTGERTTRELVEKFIRENSLGKSISCLHYPNKIGNMADQLNFALETIVGNNSFVALYNADSRPDALTFQNFFYYYGLHRSARVFQQSAFFTKNYNELGRSSGWLSEWLLKTNAILQSRWTLTHEIPRLLRQSENQGLLFRKFANAHVVGHGLFIETGLLKKNGGFPNSTVTEDLFLGFMLRESGISIYPVQTLELSDSPASLKSMWRQKYFWFWGPLSYVRYWYLLRKVKKVNRQVALALVTQGTISALAWLLSGPLVLIGIIIPILISDVFIITVAYVGIFLYGPVQYFLTVNNIYDLSPNTPTKSKFNVSDKLIISLMSVPLILIHSLPPYLSIFSELRHLFFGYKIHRAKTDD